MINFWILYIINYGKSLGNCHFNHQGGLPGRDFGG